MDALSYHVYWSPPLTEATGPGEPTAIEQEVRHFAALMRDRGTSKPIYMTEGGIRCPPVRLLVASRRFSPQRALWFECRRGAHLDWARCGMRSGARHGCRWRSAGVVNICYYYTGKVLGAPPWFSTMAQRLLRADGLRRPAETHADGL